MPPGCGGEERRQKPGGSNLHRQIGNRMHPHVRQPAEVRQKWQSLQDSCHHRPEAMCCHRQHEGQKCRNQVESQMGGIDARELRRDQKMNRSEEHTSELKSLMRISYAVFCLKKQKTKQKARNNR